MFRWLFLLPLSVLPLSFTSYFFFFLFPFLPLPLSSFSFFFLFPFLPFLQYPYVSLYQKKDASGGVSCQISSLDAIDGGYVANGMEITGQAQRPVADSMSNVSGFNIEKRRKKETKEQ